MKNFLKNKLSNSLQMKLLLMVLGIFVPILIFIIINNIYTSNLVRKQVYTANSNAVILYMKELDSSFINVEKQLSRLTSLDSNFRIIDTAKNENQSFYSTQKVSSSLSEILLTNKITDAVFIYTSQSETFIDKVNSEDDFEQLESIRDFLLNYLKTENINFFEWFSIRINDKNYFLRLLKNDTTYIGTWVSMEKLLKPFLSPELVRLNYVLFADSNGTIISSKPKNFTNKISFNENTANTYLSKDNKKYIYIKHSSINGDFCLFAFISEKEVLSGLLIFRLFFAIFIILILFLLFIAILVQKKTLIKPIKNLVNSMEEVQAGNWNVTLNETYKTNEFQLLKKTYNSMIKEIKKLKIDIYEEKLLKQKIELQFFQLQIRPHFLINTLNIIYNLSQVGKYDLIQKMSKYLIRHFQYTINSTSSLVTIKNELFYTKNYIEIQKLRFPDVLEISYTIDDSLLSYAIPPLSIQTFVENSIKYALSIEDPVKLDIKIKNLDSKKDKILITISDSGPGFSKKMLQSLSQINDNPLHIGIDNIKHRLLLLFGNDAKLEIGNSPEGGAKVKMIIPRITNSEEQKND